MSSQNILEKLKPLFYPRSIAVVGTSESKKNIGNIWVKGLLQVGFKGNVYPVGYSGGEIKGLKIFPRLSSIPDPVDYVITSIPREAVPDFLDECIAKKVQVVHFFTAGFSEADTIGRDLEQVLLQKARQGGFRIVGPNSLGIYCPEHRVPYGPNGLYMESGTVAFLCQSGGIGFKLVELGEAMGIKYSKGISMGNGIDLDSHEYLEYLAADPKTAIIGAYLEGTRNGKRLFNTLKEMAKVKPLIVWKGGRTQAGAVVAQSHTGSIASSSFNWSTALKPAGAIEVFSIDELTDTMLIFQQLGQWQGKGIGIAGGFADGGGGICVTASDTFAEHGFSLPQFSADTEQQLGNLLGRIVNILRNPVDVGLVAGNPAIIREATKSIIADPAVDMLVIQEDIGLICNILKKGTIDAINDIFIDLRASQPKPIVAVLPHGLFETERAEIAHRLNKAGIPVFVTMERAAKAIKNLRQYTERHHPITQREYTRE